MSENIQQKIQQLRTELNQHNENYYLLDEPSISDLEFDLLLKELQDLEMNHLITREIINTKPVTVEYEITEFGKTLAPIIDEVAKWGINYRTSLYGQKDDVSAE